MKTLSLCAAVCFFTTVAFTQDLNWSELARRPELWPAQCTVKAEMKFQGGATVQVGQKVNVLQVSANEVELSTTDGRTTFAAEPEETDVLAVARAAYEKLTPKQRALTYDSLVGQKELWPQHVTLNKTFDIGGGRALREGEQLVLREVQPGKLVLLSEKLNTVFQFAPQATDFMAQARKLVEDEKAAPRFVDVQKKEEEKQVVVQQKKQTFGPVITELAPNLISSVTGQPAPLDGKALPRYIVLYRGSSTCPITRQFTPTLIKYYQQMKPTHPEFEIVYLMTETVENSNKFAKEIGFSWRAIRYDHANPMPTVMAPIQGLLPQLVVMDRNGRVLANGWQNTAPNALKQLDALLRNPALVR